MQQKKQNFYWALSVLGAVLWSTACSHQAPKFTKTEDRPNGAVRLVKQVVLDSFEQPSSDCTWTPAAPATMPASKPGQASPPADALLRRESENPSDRNWALAVEAVHPGTLHHAFNHLNLGSSDTLTADVRSSVFPNPPAARLGITDAGGHQFMGDPYRLFNPWQTITLDLIAARAAGIEIEDITDIALQITAGAGPATSRCDVVTDRWTASALQANTVGDPTGSDGTFYITQQGEHLRIGQAGRFEVTFTNRAGADDPWLSLTQGPEKHAVFGAPGSGLFLLDQDHFDLLAIHQTRGPLAGDGSTNDAGPALASLGATDAVFKWSLVWSCPFAALVDVQQTGGAIARNGRPGFTADWRFLIYRTGQAYVQWQCTRDPESTVPLPVSWALSVDAATLQPVDQAPERVLDGLYADTNAPRELWPYQFQRGMPASLIAEVGDVERNLEWWSVRNGRAITGTGLPTRLRNGPLNCVLLLNQPTLLTVAGESSAALHRTLPTMQTGTLDTHFPGDPDNDGYVDALGFYAINLDHGRAIMDLDPGNRPIFHPAFLFISRDAPTTHPPLVLVDGQQWNHAPRWPDGSTLLQLPYVIDRPVHIEVMPGQ
jgi:hypothetical protein